MQYFQAVKIGKERANKAQMILFKVGGYAMLTITTKKNNGQFVPVGEENFVAVIQTVDGFVTILVDEEGYTKAQSKPLEKTEAGKIFHKLKESGIKEFPGKEVEIWTDRYFTIQSEL